VAPTDAGSYDVSAAINDANYEGSANDVLVINSATTTATVTLGDLSQTYDGTAKQAAEYVGWGGGGLVTSVYADDKAFLKDAVLGIAPFHGRIVIGSEKVSGQSLPPGMALPQLVHGGPGRAGGGEELGGRRGMQLYMQRTALQGDRALLEAIAKG